MRATAEIVADLRERARRPGGLAEEAADRLTELDNLLDMAEANLAELVARLAAVNAALDQYADATGSLVDAAIACVSAIAEALNRSPSPDREPQPSDGPDYHADHQAWADRQ